MTIEEIRKNKPKLATHYIIVGGDVTYLAKFVGGWIYYAGDGMYYPYKGTFGRSGAVKL